MKAIDLNLTTEQKVNILTCFYNCYYDTNQDTEVFSKEYYHVSYEVLAGRVPLELEFLVDFEECVFENLTSEQQQQYKEAKNK